MRKVTLEAAIKTLEGYYAQGLESRYVEKPVSWALFQAWKDIDRREKKRENKKEP